MLKRINNRSAFMLAATLTAILVLTVANQQASADDKTPDKTHGRTQDKEARKTIEPNRFFGGNAKKQDEDSKTTLQQRLAKAALERTKNIVIYNPQYFKIPYPNGDVPAHFGVCTDVIIRSYRSLGIDLQKDVHQKMGGDRNIAHRRVKVLEKFFTRYGTSLAVTKNPEDYKPGDIVTFYLDKAISSRDHIAIVSDKIGTSGAPMIIHNIGLGPKLDDDLFSFRITGHYRYGS